MSPDALALSPAALLALAGLVCVASGRAGARRDVPALGALLAVAAAVAALVAPEAEAAGRFVRLDRWGAAGGLLVVTGTLAAVVLEAYRERRSPAEVARPGRLPGLLLVGGAGAWLVAGAARAEVLGLGYALAAGAGWGALRASEPAGGRASARYLTAALLSLAALGLGLLLLGWATGSARLDVLLGVPADAALPPALGSLLGGADPGRALLATGGLLVCLGLTHLLAAAPLGFWAPGAAQAAAPPAAAWLLAVAPAAAAAAGARLLEAFAATGEWRPGLALLGVAGVTLGHLRALGQERLERLLGWLGLAQGGYLLLALSAFEGGAAGPGASAATSALIWQAAAGLLAGLGAFGVVAVAHERWGDAALHRLVGLAWRSPWLAGALLVALASHAGLPLTAGFGGRLQLTVAGLAGGVGWAVALGLANLVLAAAVALRAARLLLERDPGRRRREPVVAVSGLTLLWGSLAGLQVWLGLAPGGLVALAGWSG